MDKKVIQTRRQCDPCEDIQLFSETNKHKNDTLSSQRMNIKELEQVGGALFPAIVLEDLYIDLRDSSLKEGEKEIQ